MTWFADLSPCTYFDRSGYTLSESDRLLAVGWLSAEHAYTRGEVDRAMRAQLGRMAWCPWSPFRFLGSHACELCAAAGRDTAQLLDAGRYERDNPPRGHQNLFVPAGRVVYVAPDLVAHYIDEHEYAPPAEFCDAVRDCPPVWSDAYFQELRRSGSATFASIVPPAVSRADVPFPSAPTRWLHGFRLALATIVDSERRGDYDRHLAWQLARAILDIVAAGVEVISVEWGEGDAVLTVRGCENGRDPVEICRERTPDVPSRSTESGIDSFRILCLPWRGDPRREIRKRLAPARIDYIGLDSLRGEAKAFLFDDRPPTDDLTSDPYLALNSPSYGDWLVEIVPHGGHREEHPARVRRARRAAPKSDSSRRIFTHVPPMPANVFDDEQQKTLAADEYVRPYVQITKEQLAGLLWAFSEYAVRTLHILEDEPPAGPAAAAADPELVTTHRALVRWFIENRDRTLCTASPGPPRATSREEWIFDDRERYGVAHMKYTSGFEHISRRELVQLLTALGCYTAHARRVSVLYADGSWQGSFGVHRRLYAHDQLIHFDEHPFSHEEFVRSMRAALRG